jgi:nucleoside-diphosphate-sugar epimerase
MKKILVTGSSGFIGQHLVTYLEQKGYTVIQADRRIGINLSDKTIVDNLPDVDIVVHLAAHNGTKHFYNRPMDVIRDAVLPTQFLIDRYAGKVERFVFTGTCESYAGAIDLFDWPIPTDETVPLVVGDVNNPRWSYGGSKIVNELQITAAHNQLGQEYAIIRYHNVYGPGQIDHFIPEFVERAKTGDLSLKGWENTRSFMYISDAIRATVQIMFDKACANQIINVGVNNEVSIKDLATIILEQTGIAGELILESAPIGSVKRRCGNIDKMTKLLNFIPEVSLADGIKKTLESL